MKLSKWIDSYGWGAVAALARASGLSRGTIEKAAKDKLVSVDAAKRIAAATGGKESARALAGKI